MCVCVCVWVGVYVCVSVPYRIDPVYIGCHYQTNNQCNPMYLWVSLPNE